MWGRQRRVTGPQSAFWKQQGWVLSAGFLVVVLVLAGLAFISSLGDEPDPAEAAVTAGPLSPSAPRGADGRPVGCRTDDSETAVPTVAPTDVKWKSVGGTQVPVSTALGPVQRTGEMLWCFAHTPTGAALAAHVILARMNALDWRVSAEQQLVDNRAREFYVALHADVPDTATGTAPPSFAGFAVTRYSPEHATVKLLMSNGTGTTGLSATFVITSVSLSFDGGDWKVRPTSSGTISTSWETVSGSNGFVTWKV
jgi:hypothetical protein